MVCRPIIVCKSGPQNNIVDLIHGIKIEAASLLAKLTTGFRYGPLGREYVINKSYIISFRLLLKVVLIPL